MPNEREPIVVQKILGADADVVKSLEGENPNIPKDETRQERRARLAVVLERGIVNDILAVPNLPSHLHGEWVRADPLQIDAMKSIGFRIDTEYATKRAVHGDGSDGNRVADVIFMITEKENKEDIDWVRAEQIKRRDNRGKREESEFERKTYDDTGGEIGTFSESRQRVLTRNELTEALNRLDNQTKSG